MCGMPEHLEELALTFRHGEVRDGLVVHTTERHFGPQANAVWTRDRGEPPFLAPHPGDDGAVIETDHQLQVHGHAAATAFDHADQVRHPGTRGHEVDEGYLAVLGFEDRFQDQRAGAVAAAHPPHRAGRGDLPSAMPGAAQERGETRSGIKTRQAKPVDRSVPAHEARGLTVADQGIIFDPQSHA